MTTRTLIAIPALVAFSLMSGAAATGVTSEEDPLWYYNLLGYQAIHESGITGEGVTVAVIDSPVNLDLPTLQGADIRVQESTCLDESGAPRPGTTTDVALGDHGTNIVSYLVGSGAGYDGQVGVKGVAPGVTVLTYALYSDEEGGCFESGVDALGDGIDNALGAAMLAAVKSGADIISVSFGGAGGEVISEAAEEALRAGVVIVGGLANRGADSLELDGYPATLNGAVSVLAAQSTGDLALGFDGEPNASDFVVVLAPGADILWQGGDGDWTVQRPSAGTSIATPIVSGTLALLLEKYPDATGNQAIQSLLHNTGSEPHELQWDPVSGYGIVVPGTLLAVDPTQYPDVNLLIDDPNRADAGPFLPLYEQIYPAGATASPEVPGDPADPIEPEGTRSVAVIALVGGLVVAVVVAIVVAIAIAASRRKTQ